MRVLRRVVDDPRYSVQVLHSDLEVRTLLDAPSIDALVLQNRLKYYQTLSEDA